MQDFVNVILGNNKESLAFFSSQDQKFSSMLRFNETKKISTKSKHTESKFRDKADLLGAVLLLGNAKNRSMF